MRLIDSIFVYTQNCIKHSWKISELDGCMQWANASITTFEEYDAGVNDACGFGLHCQMFRLLLSRVCLCKFFIIASNSISHYIHISLLADYHINKMVVVIPGRQV
jgi:hypothetical protein